MAIFPTYIDPRSAYILFTYHINYSSTQALVRTLSTSSWHPQSLPIYSDFYCGKFAE